MLDTVRELFYLGKNAPAETGLHVHREPDTTRCSEICSIGLVIRSVKVELLSYSFNSMPQFIAILHFDSGSSVLMHNDRVIAENVEVGTIIANLINRELEVMVHDAKAELLRHGIEEMQATTAIRQTRIGLSTDHADDFILQTTGGSYTSAVAFLQAGQVQT